MCDDHHSAAKDSEQTIYDAATRKDLQIESRRAGR
jgi:hypothetical protein